MEDLSREREYNVVKANALIQKEEFTSVDLSLSEQKLLLRLIQMIKPEDTELKLYEFKITDYCELCGINSTGGKVYHNVKNSVKKLADKSYYGTMEDGTDVLIRWIERPYINSKNGTIKLKIDDMMKPYLLQLKEYFTKYSLLYVLTMRSKYSIRLYELLKSYQNQRIKAFPLDTLKRLINAQKYTQWNDFRRYALEAGLKEINQVSDLRVKYDTKRVGHAIVDVVFTIIPADLDSRIISWTEIEHRLNPHELQGQMSLIFPEPEDEKI